MDWRNPRIKGEIRLKISQDQENRPIISRLLYSYTDGLSEVGERLSTATYFYQIQSGDYTETRKMVVLK